MNSFREIRALLMPEEASDVLHIDCDGHELTAREGTGKVVLEVKNGDRCARREYDYDEAFRVLSALKDGRASLNVWFPPKLQKKTRSGSTAGKVIGIVSGLALALFSGFCGFAILMASLFTPNDYNLLFEVSMHILFAGWFAAGIALVVSSARGALKVRRFFGVGGGFVMFTTLVSLILGIWSTRADDPVTPLIDYIVMTGAFGLFAAAGAALMIYTLISDSGSSGFTGTAGYTSIRVEPSKKVLAPVVAAIKERTACESIRIRLDFDRQPALFDSKLGGLPYWDTSMAYPCDEESGDKLALLAQINLSQLPENNLLPRDGMLQFFIRPDIEYGLTSTSKVIYHRTVNRSIFEKEIKELGLPGSETVEYGDFPVTGEIAMDFEKISTFMTPSDNRFDRLVREIAEEMGIELFDGTSYMSFDDEFYEECTGHRIGGYPYFTQYDPRSEDDLVKYDFLLLQIDTDDKTDRRDKGVMWGDAGVGQFFIGSEALKAMKLDDVYYNWDCC